MDAQGADLETNTTMSRSSTPGAAEFPNFPNPMDPLLDPWSERIVNDGLVRGIAFDWFQDLTCRIAAVEAKIQENQDRKVATENLAKDAQTLKRLPQVRECNWEQFKNRYELGDGIPAIEALLAGYDLDREMEEEQLKRLDPEKRREFLFDNNKKGNRRLPSGKSTDTKRIERVRINSPAVLSLLSAVTGQMDWKGDKPITFLRPFKTIIHFHDKMEEQAAKLAEDFPDLHSSSMTSSGDATPTTAQDNDDATDVVASTDTTESDTARQAYLEITCYIQFVNDRLMPSFRKFEDSPDGLATKVRFTDMWALFRPGQLIFESQEDSGSIGSTRERERGIVASQPAGRRVWRVYSMRSEDISWTVDSLEVVGGTLRRNRDDGELYVSATISAYRIDYNGSDYVAVPKAFEIFPFDHEISVRKLVVYPVQYQKGWSETIKKLQNRGKEFQTLIGHQHKAIHHDGWTLRHDPAGDLLENTDNPTAAAFSQYISSDVIIDFEEAYQRHPQWKAVDYRLSPSPWSPTVKQDMFPIIRWVGEDRTHEVLREIEVVVEDDDIIELEFKRFSETDKLMAEPELGGEAADLARENEGESPRQQLTEEDLALLPVRLFVYSLRDRKFINADIRSLTLQSNEHPEDPFSELKIPKGDKALIRSVVVDHFEKKKVQRQLQSEGKDSYEQDFIPGKGQGLVILLHGAPGVGKTATAEAVAYAHKKPLFPITCGDLGTDPRTVERTLSDLFRLANIWDCVLLLDEAEVFLSRREKMDDSLQRNALVSIFLRTLEYYPGVLFLTTNRVGVLDEALNSRVHISIYFNNLNSGQTQALFQMNIRRCQKIAQQRAAITGEPVLQIDEEDIFDFATEQFDAHLQRNPSGPWWNGRQIRNAFQIATSLAYERTPNEPPGSQKYLDRRHFDQILRAINDYASYRIGVHRKSEEEMAYERAERTARPAARTQDRYPLRQYDSQQELAGASSPYSVSPQHQQHQQQQQPQHVRPPPGASPMSERSREMDNYSSHSANMSYGGNLGSQPRTEPSFNRSGHSPSPSGGVTVGRGYPLGATGA